MARLMNLVLNVWRQKSPKEPGGFVRYEAKAIKGPPSYLALLRRMPGPGQSGPGWSGRTANS